ncbi:hypothetical protein PYCCODRAFT_1478837 [Trametes coccinea BRFM310]|uniref:Uncharacterized protein n=1 Tax=Trametes coccinea (strain BRFM310) TaxID=1353009 RepID=A0A1Y2ILH6_TRAC3|nr:hypothetical protein PYCCODRAFT_1478837 [Trametes coccinea BRFM310]
MAMLVRLSSTLPSATASLARGTSISLPRLSFQLRFNSSEAAAEPSAQPSESQPEAPKKRAIPLADSLGDILISNRPRNQGQRRNGNGNNREQGGQRDRPTNFNNDGERRVRLDHNPRRPNNGMVRQFNDQPNRQWQPRRQDGQELHSVIQSRQAQSLPEEGGKEASAQPEQRPQQQRRSASQFKRGDEEPVNLPAATQIELGNLDELFGPPSTSTTSEAAVSARLLSPSEQRVQLFLERIAGDYSRYVPKHAPTTDVTKLSPLELSEFVLSKRRDVALKSRRNALTIVEKFVGARKGVEASAPPS